MTKNEKPNSGLLPEHMNKALICPKCGFFVSTTLSAVGDAAHIATCEHCRWGGPVSKCVTVATEEEIVTPEMWADYLLQVALKFVVPPLSFGITQLGLLPSLRKTPIEGKDAKWLEKHNEITKKLHQETMRALTEVLVQQAFSAGSDCRVYYIQQMGHEPPALEEPAQPQKQDRKFGGDL